MKRRWVALVLLILTAGLVALGCGSDGESDSGSGGSGDPLEVVFIYENPADTVGWEATFEESRAALDEEFGDEIETRFLDGVPASPEGRTVIERTANDGADVIIGTSFGHGEFMQELAPEFPDTHFIVSQFDIPEGVENFSGYDVRVEDGWYLTGLAAGMLAENSRDNQVGWIDGFPVPFELRQINGFTLGYRQVVPDGEVHVNLINSWYDPQKAAQASNSLVSAGGTILASGLSDPTVGEVAEQKSVPFAAVYPLTTFTKNQGLTGPRFRWEAIFAPKIQSIIDGEAEPTFDYFGATEGAIDMAPLGKAFTDNATEEQVAEYEEALAALEAGEFVPLPGDTKELTRLEYVVPGVEGTDLEVQDVPAPGA